MMMGEGEERNPRKQYFLTSESFLNDDLVLLKIKSNESLLVTCHVWMHLLLLTTMELETSFGQINHSHLIVHAEIHHE